MSDLPKDCGYLLRARARQRVPLKNRRDGGSARLSWGEGRRHNAPLGDGARLLPLPSGMERGACRLTLGRECGRCC